MTIEKITELVDKNLNKYGLERKFPVRVNTRLVNVLGQVKPIIQEDGSLGVKSMEFASELIESDDDKVFSVAAHESAHAITLLKTGEQHVHDEMWQKIYLDLDPSGRAGAEHYGDSKPKRSYKYVVTCAKCGRRLFYYYRAGKVVKHPELYISYCHEAPIKITKLR